MTSDSTPKVFVMPRLAAMMFIQFFIWGSWYVAGPNYLGTIGFTASDFAWMYSVGPIAGMISPFIVGMIADRYFAAQRVLALLHMVGAGFMFLATTFMASGKPPWMINLAFFGYMLTYFPTLSLTNTVAMRSMTNTQKQFPLIRVFGTIGWIVACLLLTAFGCDKTIGMFYFTVGSASLLGLISLTLPHTPPLLLDKTVTVRQILGIDALSLFKNPSFAVFMVCSILICIPLAFYYQLASRVVEMSRLPIGSTMSYGQMSEIFFMIVMPFFFARLGVKWMLLVGMLAWIARYALFALGAPDEIRWMIIGGVVLHGICYDFFFVTGQIYTDKMAPPNIRAQAQGMLVLFTLGLGMLIGAQVCGTIETHYTPPESIAYGKQNLEVGKKIAAAKDSLADAAKGSNEEILLTEEVKSLEAKSKDLRHRQLKAMNWKSIWLLPCIAAAVIALIFFLTFRDRPAEATAGEPPATA